MSRSIFDIQMEFGKINGYKNQMFWDLLSADQADILRDKIKNLIPDQKEEVPIGSEINDPKNINARLAFEEIQENRIRQNNALEKIRENLFNNVWAQRKYTNRNSLTSIIYVLVTKETELDKALLSKEFSCHPVFRARKCVAQNNSSECCMVFIDETARVYKNWKDYLEKNVLPKGTMVTPSKGFYTFNEKDIVKLHVCPTPASSNLTSVLETADTASAVTGFLSAGLTVVGLCAFPLAAPVMAAASAAGLATAGYSAARAGSNLVDRSAHEQSISLKDRQARGSWLGVMGGLVGFGASGATRVMTTAAAAGREVSLVTTLVVNGMNISSIVLSGSGVANGILDMILKFNDDEKITKMDALQLAASLVLFTHSVNNFRLASNIVTDTRNNTIKSYREGLSNRQRRMFDKMTKETIRIQGADKGRIDVIRSVNEMPSKQYLNDLNKINRQLNKQKMRVSFGGDKKVLLNNELPVDTQSLRNNVQHSEGPDVLSQVKQPIPTSHPNGDTKNIPNKTGSSSIRTPLVFTENYSNNNMKPTFDPIAELMKASFPLASGALLSFADLGTPLFTHVINVDILKNEVINMAHKYTDDIFRYIFEVLICFIENTLEFIEDKIGIKMPREQVLLKMKEIIGQYVTVSLEILKGKQMEIITKLTSFFRSDEAKMCARNESSKNANTASFRWTKEDAPNDSVEELMTACIILANGAVVPLEDFGRSFLEHIINFGSFKDVVLDMANEFPEETFRSMFGLTQQFIENHVDAINFVLKTPISTEAILYRMPAHILKNYENLEFVTNKSSEILQTLESYYLSLNPNDIYEKPTKCADCIGHYVVSLL